MRRNFTPEQSKALAEAIQRIAPRYRNEMRKLYKAERGMWLDWGEVKRKHTPSQQGYYWQACQTAGKALGMSQEELHIVIKREAFGSTRVETPLGPVERLKSSAGLSVEDYGVLIETLTRCCAMAGHQVEPPNGVAA